MTELQYVSATSTERGMHNNPYVTHQPWRLK